MTFDVDMNAGNLMRTDSPPSLLFIYFMMFEALLMFMLLQVDLRMHWLKTLRSVNTSLMRLYSDS